MAGGLRAATLAIALLALTGMAPPQAASTSYCATYTLPPNKQTDAFFGPMTYRVSDTELGRVLIVEGAVGIEEAEKLRRALASAGPVEEVWLNSAGGVAIEGPKMGRVLRQKGIAVRLRGSHACVSACSYAFLGGAIRVVEPGSHYGVHMFSSRGDQQRMLGIVNAGARLASARTELLRKGLPVAAIDREVAAEMGKIYAAIEKEAAQTAAIRARYLVEMSLSLDFMTDAFGTNAADVCYLSPAGLARYNVANAG